MFVSIRTLFPVRRGYDFLCIVGEREGIGRNLGSWVQQFGEKDHTIVVHEICHTDPEECTVQSGI